REIAETLAGRLKLPGFRSGRIPASVVEKRYGQALNRELLDRVIGDAYRKALQLESLQPISEGEIENITYEPDQDLSFVISFDVRPDIEVGRVGGFAIQRPEATVGEDEVRRILERLRERNGAWEPAEDGTSPEAGDLVSLSVQKLVDGEPEGEPNEYDLVLGQGDAIPDVEAAVHTLTPGGTDDFTVTFPEDFPDESRQGEKQHLRITLRARKVRRLPELDDDFARSVAEVDDLEALEDRIREDLAREARERTEMTVRGQILQNLLDANPFEVPRTMVDRYVESVLGDTGDAAPEAVARAREELRPEAERAVKRILLIDRIAETQGLRAREEELDERIETIAEKNDVSASEVYARFQKSGR
ncbi:MAG TPA: trigger factor, partial [Longimicrobiales bacterium]|nr:trigger factor [Longimicrobiales bacterium]